MKNATSKKIFYNVFFAILGQVITLVLGLILPRLRITSFGSEVNGLLSSVNQIYVYLALLEMGVGSATIQALYKPVAENNVDDVNSILSATNKYYKKTGLIYLAFIFIFAIIYPLCIKTSIDWWVIVAVILLNGLGNVLSYFFQGKYKLLLQVEGKQYIITNMATFVTLASGIAKIVLIYLGCGVISLQVVFFAFNIIQVLYFGIYILKKYKWLNLKCEPNVKAISQKNSAMVHQLTQLVFNNTDVLILTIFCGLEAVSIYAVYTLVTEMVSSFMNNIHTGFSYKLGQLYNSQKERFLKVYNLYERYYTAIAFALYSVAYVCMAPFIKLYTAGMDINYSMEYLPILFVSIKLLISGRAPSGVVSSYAGHFKQTQWRAILEMVINLVVSIVAVIFMGIYGVLLGTLAALIYRANDMIIYANKRLLNRNPWYTYKFWILFLVMFSGIVFINYILKLTVETYVDFIILGVVSLLVLSILYILVTFLFSYKDSIEFIKQYKSNRKEKQEDNN